MALSTIHSETSGFTIERTAKKMKQRFSRILSGMRVGITVDQWIVLQLLSKHNGLSQHEIGRQTYKDAPTVTRILDLLGEKSLIERRPDPADRRRFKIMLTARGRQKVARIEPAVRSFRERSYSGLSESDLERLQFIMHTISNNIDSLSND